MKIEEIRGLGDEELLKRLEEARKELFNLRFRLATRQLANHRELPKVKKRIARIQTVIRERARSRIVYGRKAKNQNWQGNKR